MRREFIGVAVPLVISEATAAAEFLEMLHTQQQQQQPLATHASSALQSQESRQVHVHDFESDHRHHAAILILYDSFAGLSTQRCIVSSEALSDRDQRPHLQFIKCSHHSSTVTFTIGCSLQVCACHTSRLTCNLHCQVWHHEQLSQTTFLQSNPAPPRCYAACSVCRCMQRQMWLTEKSRGCSSS